MALAKSQKKYLKRNIRRLSLAEIAANLNLSEKEILKFLQSLWRKEKYERFIAQQHSKEHTGKVAGFNLNKWLKQNWKALALLAFLVFAVYLNSLGNDFVADDISGIRDNPAINQISYIWQPSFLNLTIKSLFFINYKVFGLNPFFFRLTNILFHLGAVWIIYFLLSFFLGPFVCLATASLFAVHPILSESITWVSGGPHSISAFFVILALLAYIWADKVQKRSFYFFSLIAFLLGLLVTEKVIIFPLILTVYELCLGKIKTNWQKLIPYWFFSGIWGLFLFGRVGQRVSELETGYYLQPGFYNPLIQVPIAITSYLELIFWPKNLTLYHSEMTFSQIEYLARLGIFILFLAIIAYFSKKDRRLFFWLSFFLISLLPTLTPLRISWIVAERYVYLGSLGVFVFIAWLIQKIGEIVSTKKNLEKTANRTSLIILTIILILLSSRTIIRNRDWKNQDTLWLAAAKTSPSSPQNHNNLGDYYGRQGDFQRAIEEFQAAIRLNPSYADAYHNLGNTYQQIEEIDRAIENYQKALEINPNLWQSHQALAAVYFEQEKFDLAKQEIEEAIHISPQNSNLYTNLAIVYLKLGDPQNAQKSLNQALQLDPENRRAKELLYQSK